MILRFVRATRVFAAGACLAICLAPAGAEAQPLAVATGGKPLQPTTPSGSIDTVQIIDLATGRVIDTPFLGTFSEGDVPRIAANYSGGVAFIASGNPGSGSRLFRLRLATAALEPISIGSMMIDDIALSADGTRLFVATSVPSLLTLDAATGTALVAPVTLPHRVSRLARSSTGARLYALSRAAAMVTILDATSSAVVSSFATDPSPSELIAHPDGSRLLVAHSTGTTSTADGDSVVGYDATTGAVLGRVTLPDARARVTVSPAGQGISYSASRPGTLAIAGTEHRLFVPRAAYFYYHGHQLPDSFREVVDVIDTGSFTRVTTIALPVSAPPPDPERLRGIAAAATVGAADVWVGSAFQVRRIDAAALTVTSVNSGVGGLSAMTLAAKPACWFDPVIAPISFREEGGVAQVSVPTPPSGCQWTATPSDSWISVNPQSGSTAGVVTVIVPSTNVGRTGSVTIGGRPVEVAQLVGSIFIDRPSGGDSVVGPLQIVGWALVNDGHPDRSRGAGISEVIVQDETPFQPVRLLARAKINILRPDVQGAYGPRFAFSGYELIVPANALRPGWRTLVVKARVAADNTWITTSIAVFSSRAPIQSFGWDQAIQAEPGSPRSIMTGWGYDERPNIGCGISSVSVTAVRSGESAPTSLGQVELGIERADLAQSLGFGTPFPCGWRLLFDRPAAGSYAVTVEFRDVNGVVVHTIQRTLTLGSAPFGVVDTPAPGSTVSGAIAITGWALDDIGVTRVDVLFGSANTVVARGVFVEGARPDVAAAYPTFPNASRAGWGVQVLTNMLLGGGNGPLPFRVIAYDASNNATVLKDLVLTGNNSTSPLPFGTLDTPAQGASVSGSVVVFGWALTPAPAIIPVDGSTIEVLVDNVFIGRPTFNQCRGTNGTNFPAPGTCNDDIATAFGTGYRNLAEGSGAIGSFVLDTTTLTNGLHELQWRVTDSLGATQGLGSRYIYVNNPAPKHQRP